MGTDSLEGCQLESCESFTVIFRGETAEAQPLDQRKEPVLLLRDPFELSRVSYVTLAVGQSPDRCKGTSMNCLKLGDGDYCLFHGQSLMAKCRSIWRAYGNVPSFSAGFE